MPAPPSNGAPVGEGSGRLSATSRPFAATARPPPTTTVFDVLVMTRLPQHVAIIMDGNGRWAERRGLARGAGHRAGAEAVRRVVRGAREIGVPTLTLYAFSAQNWQRPPAEVGELMRLLRTFLLDECAELVARGIRLTTIGDEARLPRLVRAALAVVKQRTRRNRAMTLCLALSYGGREAIIAAARTLAGAAARAGLPPDAIDEASFTAALDTRDLPPLDLLIRTSGERRLSNFLLWESAYTELHFTDVMWPDFTRADLDAALADFTARQRRFGRVAQSVA
jgi:undecaprenyl diphosphate synthase